MSPRVLWNSLVPWRRRRRYYFRSILSRLVDLEVPAESWPAIFDVTPGQFLELERGDVTPRLFVQSLARIAYKVPAPSTSWVFGPMLFAAWAIGTVAVMAYLLLR